jgi:hypothetical protein
MNARQLAEKTIAERDRLRKLSRGNGNEPAEFQLADALIKLLEDTDELARCLYNLVCLKGHKDALGKTDIYKRNQPKVWKAAKAAIEEHRKVMNELDLWANSRQLLQRFLKNNLGEAYMPDSENKND